MNKSLVKFLINSTVIITGTMGGWLGISLVTLGQTNIAQDVESDSSNSSLAEAEKLNQQVITLYQQGKYSEAIPLAEKVLAIRRKQLGDNHPSTAASIGNLAELYRAQGRYSEAEPLYQQALAIRRKQLGENHPDTADSLNNLAGLYRAQGRYSEAEPLLRQALAIFQKQLGNHPDTAISLNNLAEVYKYQGRYSEAEPLYQQALAIFKKQLGNHSNTASSLNNLAKLYHAQGNINRAIKWQTQGIKVEEYNLSENLIAGSEQQKRDYIATISGTTNHIISLNLKSASNNPDGTNLALTTILQRKGRILDVLTNSLQILRQQTDDPKTQDLLSQLITLRTQYSNLVFLQPKDIQSSDIKRQQISKLETQTKQLEDQLSRRSAEFRNLSEPITLAKIQQLIPKNSALVELVRYRPFNPQASVDERWDEPHYAAYILRFQGEPQAIDLGEAESIEQAVDQFHHNLCINYEPTPESIDFCINKNPNSIAEVKSSAQKLEQMVMQPVRQLLGKTTNILLSPDGKLNLVPFEALVDDQNQYLVENYNFTYLTSGRDLIRLQQKFPSQEQPLVMADPLYNQEANLAASQLPQRSIEEISELYSRKKFERLEATEKEAQAIQSLLNLSSDRLLLQSQASETLLKQVQSPQLLHIATHGFFLDRSSKTNSNQASPNQINDNPLLRSGLVLAGEKSPPSQANSENDGAFTAYEASFLDLVGTKLVVLSACDTGVGETTSGEGIYGLRRALVIAGSESQLISLWKVEDNGTKDLMKAYYQTLKQSEGRTTALHEVQ
jgi:CHAT domain-containing protein/Flp pilus assembly protein TadD